MLFGILKNRLNEWLLITLFGVIFPITFRYLKFKKLVFQYLFNAFADIV